MDHEQITEILGQEKVDPKNAKVIAEHMKECFECISMLAMADKMVKDFAQTGDIGYFPDMRDQDPVTVCSYVLRRVGVQAIGSGPLIDQIRKANAQGGQSGG